MTTIHPNISGASGVSDGSLWKHCLAQLEARLPVQEFTTFILPLQAQTEGDRRLILFAPNQVVLERVRREYFRQLTEVLQKTNRHTMDVVLRIGSRPTSYPSHPPGAARSNSEQPGAAPEDIRGAEGTAGAGHDEGSDSSRYTFENHIEGESNKIARAACQWASNHPGSRGYNPLYIYGASGLGKTHLMHAIRNQMRHEQPQLRIAYVPSVDFVEGLVQAIRKGRTEQFQRYYRSLDALLLDDIQFLANKKESQNQLFRTFNELYDRRKQIVLACDRRPVEFETSTTGENGIQKRLATRFGSGLTVNVAPPELETRVAILKEKADSMGLGMGDEMAFFVAQNIHSNVRDLEGALYNIMAYVRFTGDPMTIDTAQKALSDHLSARARLVTVENIQKIVAEYYRIRVSALRTPGRTRPIVRARQLAMALARELTDQSLPNIGEAFGGFDHTTVLYACNKIRDLRQTNQWIDEDYDNLRKTLIG